MESCDERAGGSSDREHEENLPEIISIAEIRKTVAFHRTEETGEGAQATSSSYAANLGIERSLLRAKLISRWE